MFNQLLIFTLKGLKKIAFKIFQIKPLSLPGCEISPDIASKIIYEHLTNEKPCMIARFGSTELSTVVNFIGVNQKEHNCWNYIIGRSLPWWWNQSILEQMKSWSGFFPISSKNIEQFSKLIIEDMKQIDILGSWLVEENYFYDELRDVHKIFLLLFDPFWSKMPWTRALKGKKILVIHPFSQTIESQYKKRKLLFQNDEILPDFELKTFKAIQTLGGNDSYNFKDWFEALNFMKKEIEKIEFDICLIGAGAYGFPLAAHIKRLGKKSVHLGGSLQLLFGISGKRWEDKNYNEEYKYFELINENWVRPNETEKPFNANSVEGGCYW